MQIDPTTARTTIREIIAGSKMNWTRSLQQQPILVKLIEDATPDHADRPFKERVLIFLIEEGPVCKNGKTRKFASIDAGWSYCSRDKSCLCLADHKSHAISEARRAGRTARVEAAQDARSLEDTIAIPRIETIAREAPKQIGIEIQKDAALFRWVLDRSAGLPDHVSLSERCYVALNGSDLGVCHRGNRRKFSTFSQGYEGCCETDSQCACRREAQSEAMLTHHADLDAEERQRRVTIQQETVRSRYGVENTVNIPGVRDKMVATSTERYGHTHHMRNEEVRARWADSFEKRYGVRSPGSVPEFHERRVETNLERHGAPSTMHLARDAYQKQTGLANPFQHPEVQEKAKATMLSRHGVERALKSPVIRDAMREKLLARYGAGNVMQIEDVRVKLRSNNVERIGRISPNQAHFSDETYEILTDRERFAALFVGRSLRDVAVHLGIGYDTARKYCYRFGIPLPKSSYETALRDFILSLGIDEQDVISPTRKLIAPYEVDLYIPSRDLAIEFCGLYWHRDAIKDTAYHLMKLDRVRETGTRLITIAEDEWVHNQAIVKRRLAHALGVSQRGAGARSCMIRTISAADAKDFLDRHHLQGSGVYGFVNYGAYHGNALVGVMTFSRGRIGVGQRRIELLRFATDGRTFPGLAQRLFGRFIQDFKPESVLSYADRRWSDGNVYRKMGFIETRVTEPNYWYVDCDKIRRYHRFLYRKDKISHLVDDPENMTEREIMSHLGFFRFYDCGSYVFEWKPV